MGSQRWNTAINIASTIPHAPKLWSKVITDVINGRAIVFDKHRAHQIRQLRISPVGLMEEKNRIIHDLSFPHNDWDGATSDTADTNFVRTPPVELGHVIKDILLRMMYLREHDAAARIVISKMDISEAYRQIPIYIQLVRIFPAMLCMILFCLISGYKSGGVVARVFGDDRRLRSNSHIITQRIVVHACRMSAGRLRLAEPRNRPLILIPVD